MKVTTKKLSDTKVEVTVTLDQKDLQIAEEQAILRLSKEIKVQGFRPGKVPAEIAKKNINPNDLASTTADIAVRRTVPQAFEEAKNIPLVIPNVDIVKYVPGETLEYKAVADIVPEIKLGDYKNLKVKREEFKAKPSDIDDVLARVRNAYAEKQVVKREAKMDDEVVIDFEGSLDGEKFEGGAAKDFKLKLGSHQFIPGFEEGIVGHSAGDRFDLELTFPKDYHAEKLAGKKTVFNVLLKQVNEFVLPELNDEFAKKCGPFKTLEELKLDIENNLTEQNKVKSDEKFKDDLVNELIKKSKISAPEILVEDQIRFIKQDIEANANAQGLNFEDYLKQTGQTEEDWKKQIKELAETRVKASLALQMLAREEKIDVDNEIVDAKLNELREVYKKSKEALASLKDNNVRQDIKNRMVIEKTLNFLVKLNSKNEADDKKAK
jgi:trigger factor